MSNMKDLAKNKWAVAGIIAVIVVIIIAGMIFIQNKKTTKAPVVETSPEERGIVMKPEDIGLVLTPNAAGTEVAMKIGDVSKFTHFDYEMNYDAIMDGESVSRGAIGSGDVKPGETSINREITIGTCSSGTCKYDKGVTKIAFIITLQLKNGKKGSVEKDLVLTK